MLENVTVMEKDKNLKLYLYFFVKRCVDLFFSFFGLIATFFLAIFIKLFSILTGDLSSIFYMQERIGKDGRIFKMYKFRSMIPNADQVLDELLKKDKKLKKEYQVNKKLKNDPRVTKIGTFLRKTSLDEFPQFLNVFFGEMSLIGNRPYLPRERKDMGIYYEYIIKTKPGITGLWQVSGRSNTTFEERLKLEKYYSNHCGLKMDIKIFFKTFAVVLLKKGAK